jgi:hypothetical protein
MRKLFVTLTLLALGLGSAFLIASPRAGARTTVDGTLTGHVGSQQTPNAFSIGLSADTVAPGTYELDITDYATIHNFHFCTLGSTDTSCAAGGLVNVATTISGTGLSTFQVTLTPGTYLYRCDAHSVLSGILTVSDGSTTTATTTTSTTSTTSTTTTTPAFSVKILSTKATHKVVTVKVKASAAVHFTASLFDKTSTDLVDTTADGTTATLKLQPAQKLTKGKYLVKVTGDNGTTTVTKQKKVVVM